MSSRQLDRLADYIDIELFKLILEGIFSNWRGDYDVLLADKNEYLQLEKGSRAAQLIYTALRETKDGREAILRNDIRFSEQAFVAGRAVTYLDYLGLFNVAFPIAVDSRRLATILYGRVLPRNADEQVQFRKKIEKLEAEPSLKRKHLSELSSKLVTASDELLEEVSAKLRKLDAYMKSMGPERRELSELRLQRERNKSRSEGLIDSNVFFRDVSNSLNDMLDQRLNDAGIPRQKLWERLNIILDHACDLLDASFIILFVPTYSVPKSYKVVASGKMPLKHLTDSFVLPENLHKRFDDGMTKGLEIPYGRDFRTLVPVFRKHDQKMEAKLNKAVIVPVRLDAENVGLLLTLFGHSRNSRFENREEVSILEYLGTVVQASYHTWDANEAIERERERQEKDTRDKIIWMEKITHQLMAPFHGLQASAELLLMRLDSWQNQRPEMFSNWSQVEKDFMRNNLNTISWTTNNTAQILGNLSWRVGAGEKSVTLDYVDDVAKFLIEIARDYQSLAAFSNVRVNVEPVSFLNMNSRIKVDEDTFKQAIGNIIDNAVKYSLQNSAVSISGYISDDEATISVANIGIKLDAVEIPKIFEYTYRAPEAHHYHAPGTGIGLPIAREIVEMHGGRIEVEPSRKAGFAWKTDFLIKLPLEKKQ